MALPQDTNAVSTARMNDETSERKRLAFVGASALNFLQCSHIVGLVTGTASGSEQEGQHPLTG